MRWNTYIAKKQLYELINYGALYNWYAVKDSRGITAINWGISSRANFISVETTLGGSAVAGGHLKETGFTFWNTPNTGADNLVGMNIRGNSYRAGDTGIFAPIKVSANLWTTDEYSLDTTKGRYFQAATSNTINSTSNIVHLKSGGLGIRAMRNATTEELLLPDGAISVTYQGNDLKIYRCCKVGSLIFTADNLAETKFRNGDWITGYDGGTYTPISNSIWLAKTTEAMCIINDDESKM